MSKKTIFGALEKYKIVLEAIRGVLTQAQIVAKYHVHTTQISN